MKKQIRETKNTKQFEILNEAGEIIQKVCRTCQQVKLIDEFPKYTEGHSRADCHECYNKKQRNYIQKNADMKAVYRQRERARRVGAPDNYTLEDYLELKAFSNGRCMISGKKVEQLQADHVQALSKRWLGSTKGNIILVSEEVNQAKRDLSLFEFLESERSKGLVDTEQLKRTLIYLAKANEMSLKDYIHMLKLMEELAVNSKTIVEVS